MRPIKPTHGAQFVVTSICSLCCFGIAETQNQWTVHVVVISIGGIVFLTQAIYHGIRWGREK